MIHLATLGGGQRRSADSESEGRVSAQGEQQRGPRVSKTADSDFRKAKVARNKARPAKGSADKTRVWLSKAKNCEGGCRLDRQEAGEMKGVTKTQLGFP